MGIVEDWAKARNDADEMQDKLRKLSSSRGLHFVLLTEELDHFKPVDVETIIKKCLLYSEKTLVFSKRQYDAAVFPYYSGTSKSLRHLEKSINVEDQNSGLLFFPRGLTIVEHDHDGSGRPIDEEVFSAVFLSEPENPNAVKSDLEKRYVQRPVYKNPNAVKVGLNDAFVSAQFSERAHDASPARIWFPYVKGISLDTFLRLRNDEIEDFSRLHRALKIILNKLPKASGHRKVVEIGELVDYEINCFETKIRTLRRKYSTSLGEIGLGTAALVLCAMLPEPLEQIVSGLVGATQIKTGTKRLIDTRLEKANLEESDFYIAWLLHREK